MLNLKSILFSLAFVALLPACSHGPKKTETSKPSADGSDGSTTDVAEASPTPHTKLMSANDYLNQIALPKIMKSKAVHECFLTNPRATKKELRKGKLSYRFEIKLVAESDHVAVEHVYLSSFTNVPEWAKPCMIEKYEAMKLPAFQDPDLKTTSAFGEVNMSWNPKQQISN